MHIIWLSLFIASNVCAAEIPGDYQKALSLEDKGEYKKSSDEYRKLLQRKTTDPLAWNNLGLLQQKLGKTDIAEVCFQKAIKLSPTEVQAYNNLAGLFIQQGKMVEAEKLLIKASELQPDYPYTFNNLGGLYKQQNKLYKAVEMYKKAIDKAPLPEFYYTLGLLYYDMKKYDDMLETFNKAIELKPDFSEVYYSLAMAHVHNLLGYAKDKRQSELKKVVRKLEQYSPEKAKLVKAKVKI
jgi:protein O-GlcNAc transferase